jgi:excisionase family DNA binding protein
MDQKFLGPTINASQAATLLGCSKDKVERLASRRKLPGHKFGREWMFVTEQLLAHAAALCAANLRADPPESELTPQATVALLETPVPPARSRGRPRRPVPALTPEPAAEAAKSLRQG